MPNVNKNIIMQAGAAVANATNKAAGLSASTPEPGTIISAIQLVNGGRMIGPDALAHFTESVRNKLLSLLVSMEPIQSGSGTPSPDNVRPINGRTGLNIYVSPTPNAADANTYAVDWTSEAGTVYGGTLDVVTGVLTVDRVLKKVSDFSWGSISTPASHIFRTNYLSVIPDVLTPLTTSTAVDAISDAYKAKDWNSIGPSDNGSFALSPAATNRFVIIDHNYSTVDAFVAGAGNYSILFRLAIPLTYQLTGTDIVTLVGDNYIWSDSGDVTITE